MTLPNVTRRTAMFGTAGLALTTLALDKSDSPAAAAGSGVDKFPHSSAPVPVAILIDTAATVIDFAGPWEVFQDVENAGNPGFQLYTVAPSKTLVTATAGLLVMPEYDFTDAPMPKILIIGAQGNHLSHGKIEWIRRASVEADIVMSVCTGAFLLAKTGLIDGLSATTHHDFYDKFEKQFPKIHLVRGRRFVDNGKFLSAGGLTSGIDASIHVVARYFGETEARKLAVLLEHHSDGWLTGLQK